MRLLYLTNNVETAPLRTWLAERSELAETGDPITAEDARNADIVVSYGYRHIIRADVLAASRFVNLHISYLPFNRGADPNAWAHIDGTPCGVTIHQIDEGVDTGPILVQSLVEMDDVETLALTYSRLQRSIQRLFRENWEGIRDDTIIPRPQRGAGSHHYAQEFAAIRDALLGAEGWDVQVSTLKARARWLRAAGRLAPSP